MLLAAADSHASTGYIRLRLLMILLSASWATCRFGQMFRKPLHDTAAELDVKVGRPPLPPTLMLSP